MAQEDKETKIHILRGDGFDTLFADYYGTTKFTESHKELNIRDFAVGKTDISYRVINHWDENNLLPDGVVQGGWRKFNFVEMVWLRVVQHLRDFGMSLKFIETAKEGIMEWNKENDTYLLFEFYLVSAMNTGTDTYAIVNRSGLGAVASTDEISILRRVFGPQDLIAISLKGVLNELGAKGIPSAEISLAIEGKEAELIALLQHPNKEIKVTKKNGHINGFETTETYPNLESIKGLNKTIKDKKLYGEITVKYENGKEQSAELKTRRKLP